MAVAANTPIELIQGVYSTLDERLTTGRERLGRGLTLAEKVLLNHLRDASQEVERARTYNDFDPDRVAMTRPSRGVKPMVVSTERSPATAASEEPAPRWHETTRAGRPPPPEAGHPASSAARRAT